MDQILSTGNTLHEPADYNRPGQCVFYPVWDRLPSLYPVVWTLMARLRNLEELGGDSSATRLPPGGRIERHSDAGAWHAERYNCKCYIALEANRAALWSATATSRCSARAKSLSLTTRDCISMINDGTTQRTTHDCVSEWWNG